MLFNKKLKKYFASLKTDISIAKATSGLIYQEGIKFAIKVKFRRELLLSVRI